MNLAHLRGFPEDGGGVGLKNLARLPVEIPAIARPQRLVFGPETLLCPVEGGLHFPTPERCPEVLKKPEGFLFQRLRFLPRLLYASQEPSVIFCWDCPQPYFVRHAVPPRWLA